MRLWYLSDRLAAVQRTPCRLSVSNHAAEILTFIARHHRLSKAESLARLLEWFTEQPQSMQALLLALYPKHVENEIARFILKQRELDKKASTLLTCPPR
jgi:hypothetical protein